MRAHTHTHRFVWHGLQRGIQQILSHRWVHHEECPWTLLPSTLPIQMYIQEAKKPRLSGVKIDILPFVHINRSSSLLMSLFVRSPSVSQTATYRHALSHLESVVTVFLFLSLQALSENGLLILVFSHLYNHRHTHTCGHLSAMDNF